MNLIILCLVLGLSSVLIADHVSNSVVPGMKYPGNWPESYPTNAEAGWAYSPLPPNQTYPTDFNEGIEGNLF